MLSTGLLLQLLVNPQLESASKLTYKFLKSAFNIGPIRVWRWCRALFYPLAVGAFVIVETNIWMPLVSFTNRAPQEARSHARALGRTSSTNPRRSSIFCPKRLSLGSIPGTKRLSYASSGELRLSTSIAVLNRSSWKPSKKIV